MLIMAEKKEKDLPEHTCRRGSRETAVRGSRANVWSETGFGHRQKPRKTRRFHTVPETKCLNTQPHSLRIAGSRTHD